MTLKSVTVVQPSLEIVQRFKLHQNSGCSEEEKTATTATTMGDDDDGDDDDGDDECQRAYNNVEKAISVVVCDIPMFASVGELKRTFAAFQFISAVVSSVKLSIMLVFIYQIRLYLLTQRCSI